MKQITDKHLVPCACFVCLEKSPWTFEEFDVFHEDAKLNLNNSVCDLCNEGTGAHADKDAQCDRFDGNETYFTNKDARSFRADWKAI